MKTQKLGGNTDGEISPKQPGPGTTIHCNEGKEARKSVDASRYVTDGV